MSEETSQLEISSILIAAFIKQCSEPFNCGMHSITDQYGQPNSVFSEDGFAYISPDPPDEPRVPEFERTVKLSSPQSEEDSEQKLQTLTDELKSITESVNDITITEFHVEWGIAEGSPPYLINCDGSSFTFSNDILPFSFYYEQILLFIGYESALTIMPGTCITPDRECVGCQLSVNRQKFETVQVQKFFEPLLKGGDVIDIDALSQYIVNRLTILFPQMMMSNVPCCRHCFSIYSRVSSSRPSSKSSGTIRGRATLNMTAVSASTAPRPSPLSAEETRKRVKTNSKKKQPILPLHHYTQFQQTPSGLTVIQTISQNTYRKSYTLYNSDPFPAFFQHH